MIKKEKIHSFLLVFGVALIGVGAGSMVTAKYHQRHTTNRLIDSATTDATLNVYTLMAIREDGNEKAIEMLETDIDSLMIFFSAVASQGDQTDNRVSDAMQVIEDYRSKYPRNNSYKEDEYDRQ